MGMILYRIIYFRLRMLILLEDNKISVFLYIDFVDAMIGGAYHESVTYD